MTSDIQEQIECRRERAEILKIVNKGSNPKITCERIPSVTKWTRTQRSGKRANEIDADK